MVRALLLPLPALPFLGKDELGLLNYDTSSWWWVSLKGDGCENRTWSPKSTPRRLHPLPFFLFSANLLNPPPSLRKLRVHYEQKPRVNTYMAEILLTYWGCPRHRQSNRMASDCCGAGNSKDLCGQNDLFIKQI